MTSGNSSGGILPGNRGVPGNAYGPMSKAKVLVPLPICFFSVAVVCIILIFFSFSFTFVEPISLSLVLYALHCVPLLLLYCKSPWYKFGSA